jgi:hypothetical protein
MRAVAFFLTLTEALMWVAAPGMYDRDFRQAPDSSVSESTVWKNGGSAVRVP